MEIKTLQLNLLDNFDKSKRLFSSILRNLITHFNWNNMLFLKIFFKLYLKNIF